MAFQTFENDENNRGQIKRKNLKIEIRSTWLNFTTKLEPISNTKSKPSPARPDFYNFSIFYPRRTSFLIEKKSGLSGRLRWSAWQLNMIIDSNPKRMPRSNSLYL